MTGRALTDEQKDEVLAQLGDAWKMQPELRFGQLLACWLKAYTRYDGYDTGASSMISDRDAVTALFYTEDVDIAHNVKLWAERTVLQGVK